MGVTSLIAVLGALAVLPVLRALGRRSERETLRRWSFVVSPAARELFEEIRHELRADLDCADASYAAALALTGRAKRRMLDVAVDDLLETTPGVLDLLRQAAEFSRKLAVLSPARPLARRRFRHRDVRGWAGVHDAVRPFLVSLRERFAFRVYVLRQAVRIVARYLSGERARGSYDRPSRLDAAWTDYRTLSDDALESFRLVLASATACRAEERVPRPALP
jgi:hypothetical protein